MNYQFNATIIATNSESIIGSIISAEHLLTNALTSIKSNSGTLSNINFASAKTISGAMGDIASSGEGIVKANLDSAKDLLKSVARYKELKTQYEDKKSKYEIKMKQADELARDGFITKTVINGKESFLPDDVKRNLHDTLVQQANDIKTSAIFIENEARSIEGNLL